MKDIERRKSHISNYIKRYPFNGRSEYLIDKFYIIGYNVPTLNKLLFENNTDNDSLSKYIILDKIDEERNRLSTLNLQPFHFEEDPILLNEIASDYDKKCLNYDIMKDMILPNKILLYYSEEDLSSYNKEKEKTKDKEEPESEEDNFIIYEKNDNFNNELLKTTTVIFSSNPQTENNSKKSINGFAYIFYKKLKKKKFTSKKVYSFYIPIIFSIVSEYPFFNSFYKLCHQIKILYNLPNNDIPIEIMLCNLIKFTESPINGTVLLSIKPFLLQINENMNNDFANDNIIIEETNDEEEVINKISDDNDNSNKKESKDFGVKSIKLLKKQSQIENNDKSNELQKSDSAKYGRSKSTTYINLFGKNKKKKNIKCLEIEEEINLDELFPKLKFEILPGYPLIQYNLAKVLLDIMSPIHIIEIFLYTFLEKNVIFFSKNLQYLSTTINTYLNLNFPLNDEKYYFINASVSLDNYMNNNSPFIGSAFTTIIGINSSYNAKYLKSPNKIKDHLAVNLDKDEIYRVDDKEQKENSKKNKDLFNYIKKICKKEVRNEKNQTILAREISILYKKLCEINNLLHNTNENELENNPSFKLFKNGDYMDYDDNKSNYIKRINIEIQDAFYRLFNNLCLYFYQNLSIKAEDDDLQKQNKKTRKKIDKTEVNVIFRDDYKDVGKGEERIYNDEEMYFLDEICETMKYESFVYCFIQSYSPIDLYKIPLTFTEEFLSIITRKGSILEKDINFFEIIDRLYDKKKVSVTDLDFLPFFTVYNKEYKKIFDREIEEMNDENVFNDELIKMKYFYDKNKKNKFLKYKGYQLDNNLLMKYMNMINYLDQDQFNTIFYMASSIEKNQPENILVIDIENIIENYSYETQLLSQSDLCCSNIILLFSLGLNFLDETKDYVSFLNSLFHNFTIFRKYYSYITNMIYVLFSNNIKNNNYSRANFYLILYYICLNNMRDRKIVPNEGLMNVMKKFNELDKKLNEKTKVETKKDDPAVKVEVKKENEINKIDYENLFTRYNFSKKKIFKENEIIKLILNDSTMNIEGKIITPKIRYQNNDVKIETVYYTQINILNKLINVYNNFITDLDEKEIDFDLLVYCSMNILVYQRNLSEFQDLEEIIGIVETIFYLFLDKIDKKNK